MLVILAQNLGQQLFAVLTGRQSGRHLPIADLNSEACIYKTMRCIFQFSEQVEINVMSQSMLCVNLLKFHNTYSPHN